MRRHQSHSSIPVMMVMHKPIALVFCIVLALASLARANVVPVAANGSETVEPGKSIAVTLAATDADGDTLDYIITALPTKGTVSVSSTTLASTALPYTIPAQGKLLTYTADAADHGAQTIKFKANDGTGDSTVATITVLVNRSPTASAITTFATTPSTDLKVTLPATDPDGDALSYSITSLPGHGRLLNGTTALVDTALPLVTAKNTITYSPDAAYHGPDKFKFTATDGTGTTDAITVTVNVNTTPVPDVIAATVVPDGFVTILLTSVDADKDPVSYVVLSLPTHGTLQAGGTEVTEADLPAALGDGSASLKYLVEKDYHGTDSFHYRVQDAVSQSGRAVVTIAVNTPPASSGITVSAPGAQGTYDGVLMPTDADGDTLTVRVTRLPAGGALKVGGKAATKTDTVYTLTPTGLAFSYTPGTGTATIDFFEWIANDGKNDSSPGEVTFKLKATPPITPGTNDPPPATAPDDSELPDLPEAPESDIPQSGCAPLGTADALLLAAVGITLNVAGRRRFRFGRSF